MGADATLYESINARAKRLGVSRPTIVRQLRSDAIKCVRVGRLVRIPICDAPAKQWQPRQKGDS
jgi:excisionase family DNA binding protein